MESLWEVKALLLDAQKAQEESTATTLKIAADVVLLHKKIDELPPAPTEEQIADLKETATKIKTNSEFLAAALKNVDEQTADEATDQGGGTEEGNGTGDAPE